MSTTGSIIKLFFCISIAIRNIDSYTVESEICGILYENPDFNGNSLPVGNGDSYGRLGEEYLSSEFVWNSTKSWKVSSDCELVLCNQSYFGGFCQKFQENVPSIDSLHFLDSGIDSANCTCNTNCKCSDVEMDTTISACARAYLSTSCNTCFGPYTELKGSKSFFNFQDTVKSLIIRKNCSLTTYTEEEYEGESFTWNEGIVEDFDNEAIRSYECSCSEMTPVNLRGRLRNDSAFPELVDIPDSIAEIMEMLSQTKYINHPALRAALNSVQNKRSPKNAYILVLGSSGSGKSSTINLLLSNPSLTKVGSGTSTTAAIHEFRIPVQVDRIGLGNGELRIIDTPGLGDTNGLDRDAKFLATLENFILNHEELKYTNRLPNTVLIFHSFTDNRYDGIGSNFVKLLRSLDSFRSSIMDQSFSNVIFVFTHFASEGKDVVRNPTEKLEGFRRVIETYGLFPKPILMVVSENKPEAQDIPLINGYAKLPNGEYYPKNLFHKFDTIFNACSDPIGKAIIITAFQNIVPLNVINSTTTPLVEDGHEDIPYYLDILKSASYSIDHSEVSLLITQAYEKMDSELKAKFPETNTFNLQRALYLRNIYTKEDVPKTNSEIIQLLENLDLNQANLYLLCNGIGLEPPKLDQNILPGHSYNVMGDVLLSKSPIVYSSYQVSRTGFTLPPPVIANIPASPTKAYFFEQFDNLELYKESRIKKLNINESIPLSSFTGTVRPGFNVKSENEVAALTGIIEYRTFQLSLNDELELTTEFTNAVNSLKTFNETSLESVQAWNNFFSEYGTHVLKSCWMGDTVEVKISPEIGEMLNMNDILEEGESSNSLQILTELFGTNIAETGDDIENWEESVKYNPKMLTNEISLIPISNLLMRHNPAASAEIERATKLFFNSSLNFVNVTYIKLIEEMEQKRIEAEKKIRELELRKEKERKEAEEAAERERIEFERIKKVKEEEARQENIRRQQRIQAERAELARREEAARIQDENDRRYWEHQRQLELQRQRDEARRQQEAHNAWIRSIEEQNRRIREQNRRNSCLRKGTQILLANRTTIPVEQIQIGDIVLDHKFQPTRVVSTLEKFLLDDAFFGFDKDNYFFTKTHLIGGESLEDQIPLFYVTSLKQLYDENPLLQLQNNFTLAEFKFNSQSENNILMLNRTEIKDLELISKPCKIYHDPKPSPRDTLVHMIGVDSPHGTYFANGIVCRHELPPLELWPNTMSLLFEIVNHPRIDGAIAKLKYTVENVEKLIKAIREISTNIEQDILSYSANDNNHFHFRSLYYENEETNITPEFIQFKVFNEQMYSVMGMELYSSAGKFLSSIFDNSVSEFKNVELLGLRQLIKQAYTYFLIEALECLVKN